MTKIALRVRDESGEIYVFERGASGNFELGDPIHKKEKHKSENLVQIATLSEALQAIADGYHPRMREVVTGQFNMISPENVQIVDVPS